MWRWVIRDCSTWARVRFLPSRGLVLVSMGRVIGEYGGVVTGSLGLPAHLIPDMVLGHLGCP
jgi:hypothetical protein